jgi:hypothetical protein
MATNLIARNQLHEEETMAEDDALFQKGMPIRREVLGAEYVDASIGSRRRIYDVVPAGDHRLGMGLGAGGIERSTERPAV